MPNQPMAEVFGFQINDLSPEAQRHRQHHLCPFNNKVPSCTKDKASDPLGVCSVHSGNHVTITCPIRFRQEWLIATDAAEFFFPAGSKWTSFTEIRLNDANGKSAGNIDVVLVSYDETGVLTGYGALEVQAVYISGNIRRPFRAYMENPEAGALLDWRGKAGYPHADFLSSSRKRLAPQMIYKGGILHAWRRKMAVAVDRAFFAQLPNLPQVAPTEADLAWLVYDLIQDPLNGSYRLTRVQTVYTQFMSALLQITNSAPGPEKPFLALLQRKLVERQPPDKPRRTTMTVADVMADEDSMVVDED